MYRLPTLNDLQALFTLLPVINNNNLKETWREYFHKAASLGIIQEFEIIQYFDLLKQNPYILKMISRY